MEPLGKATAGGVLDEVRNEGFVESLGPASDIKNTGRRHLHLRIPVRWLAIGAVLAVLTGVGGWLGWVAVEHHQRDVASTQALDAAKKYALTLCNIDASTVDKNFTELFNSSTEGFNDAHEAHAATLRQMIIDKKVTAHGNIAEATAESVTPNKVEVALLVDQSVSNRDMPHPANEHTHLTMTMEKVGGRWLASDVKLR